MALTIVQHKSKAAAAPAGAGSTLVSPVLTSTPAQNNLLFLTFAWNETPGTGVVTTPSGWTLVPTDGDVTNGNVHHVTYYRRAPASAATSYTVNFSGVNGNNYTSFLAEFNDSQGGSWSIDKSAHATGTSTSPASGTTATTTHASEVWIAFLSERNIDIPTSPTNSFSTADTATTGGGANSSKIAGGLFYRVVSSTAAASMAATLANSRDYCGTIATFYVSLTGAANVSALGTLSATGTRKARGAAAVTGTGTLAATGRHTGIGAAALTGTGTMLVSSSEVGAAALTGTGTLTAAGIEKWSGVAALNAFTDLSATGTIAFRGAAALTGMGILSASAISPSQDLTPETETGSIPFNPVTVGSLGLVPTTPGSMTITPE